MILRFLFNKTTLIISLLFSSVLILSWFSFTYGVRPKVIGIMKPTAFKNKQQMGAVLFRRFFKDVQVSRLMVMGIDSSIDPRQDVWTGFLKTAKHYKQNWEVAYVSRSDFVNDLGLTNYFKSNQISKLTWKSAQEALSQNKRVLIFIDNQVLDLKNKKFLENVKKLKYKKMIIGLGKLFIRREDEGLVSDNCNELELTWFLESRFCAAVDLSRKYYRKKYPLNETRAAMNKYLSDHYYLFIYDGK